MDDKKKVWYLASPYSHKDQAMVQKRYEAINKIGAKLCQQGYILIEPIAMCHEKSLLFNLSQGYEYWKDRDRTFIERSDGILVAMMPGWKESVGVTDEIEYAKELGKEVIYLSPMAYLHLDEIQGLK